MKIYFENKELHPLHEFINMIPPIVITNNNGYSTMVKNAANAIKNGRDIYTNELSLLGASEIFGSKFLHHIFIRENNTWVELNPHIIKKLESPINIEQYFRRYICK